MTANQVGGAMSAPTLDARPEAQFSRFARSVKYTGASVVGMVVDTDGKPANLRVVSPAGLGLDEQALAAVKGWHLTPAKRNGIPVKTEIDVEVSFKIY